MQSRQRSVLARALTICLMALPLLSCASAAEYCLLASKIGVEEGDVLTDKTARRILKHDMTHEELCGG